MGSGPEIRRRERKYLKRKEMTESEDRRSYEEAFASAEGAVEALERGELTLEESVLRYEEGSRALKRCFEVLRSFEKRIEVLAADLGSVAEGAASPTWKPAPEAGGSSVDEE